jgi:anaerobic magnesium-protoporphyrin IX monomethyl ester cyclase
MVKKINKIMLILPPAITIEGQRKICQVPLGLLFLASGIKNDYDVKILDCVVEGYSNEKKSGGELIVYGLGFPEIREEIERFKPDVVGISMQSTAFFLNGKAIAKLAKYVDRDIIVVAGGAFPSSNPNIVIKDGNIDYIVIGEGEVSFRKLLDSLRFGTGIDAIDGIIYRKHGEVVVNEKKTYIENLDGFPFMDLSLVPYEKYFNIRDAHFVTNTEKATHIITSRGCPNDCSFCTIHDVWGYKFRARSSENVINEIDRLVNEYGITEIHFEDDNIAFDNARAVKIFEGLRKYGLSWALPNGISIKTLNRDLLKLMRESGCYSMALPFESGNLKTLKEIIRKDVDLEYSKKMCSYANDLGIETYGFFIIGFPGESYDDIMKTLDFSISLGLKGIYIFYATPFPGTRLLEQVKKLGYVSDDFDSVWLTIERPTFSTDLFNKDELYEFVKAYVAEKKSKGYNFL